MNKGPVPYDDDAERGFLGCVLIHPSSTIPDATEYLLPSDIYQPKLGNIYFAAINVFFSGAEVNAITVAAEMQKRGISDIDIADVTHIINFEGSGRSWRSYADIIIDRSRRRKMISGGLELIERAKDLTIPSLETLETHQVDILTMDMANVDREPDDISVEEFMQRPKDDIAPWVIHGLARRGHKLMVVGPEGGGKSWLLRFIAICAAYGIQPFRHERIKPVRTLIVDLENPEDALYDSFEAILKQVTRESQVQETVNRLWWRPAGINLRSRADLAELENVIKARQPDLVCLGPLYAAYENKGNDFGWETATREVQSAFRKLIARHQFTLMIEDHAPQDRTGGYRPYGSSFWLRWPEMGIGMEPILDDNKDPIEGSFNLKRWRGDRLVNDWPKRIERGSSYGSPWPFVGSW